MQPRVLRFVAAGAAAASALLYFLIGFEVLYIGQSANGQDPGLLGFGLTVGTVFLASAALVLLVRNRWVLGVIAAADLIVIVGYFALAGVRVPPFELWGLTIKALQVVSLAAIGRLLLVRRPKAHRSDALTARARAA